MPDNASALQLILTADPALMAIVRLSLLVSLAAVFFGALVGVPFGAAVALTRFAGRDAVIVVLNALMGLPPVVVGLFVYLLLSRAGPLGSWGLLFTPQAMIVAQTVLIAPIIAALTRQTRGRVTWGGREDAEPTHRAIMFQRPAMLRRSTAGNIRYALAAAGVPRAKRASRVDELAAIVGLAGLGGRPARKLSGGEQQRLALARALAKDPQILLLDEPTASLDPAATKAIEDVVRAVAARGIKVVMSTHDLGEAKRLAGEIVFMHRGRVIESGAADTFFADPRTEEARRFMRGELLV